MFQKPYELIPETLTYLIFTMVVTILTSYLFYTIFSVLKAKRISVKVKKVEDIQEKGVEKETPALQEEQSHKTEGGNDEKVRDDGSLQTKSQ